MKMFEELALKQFKKQLHKDFRELFPDETKHLNDESLYIVIERGFDKCATYKLTSKHDTRRYIELSIEYGKDFDQDTWILSTLNNEDLEANHKIDKIEERLMFSQANLGN